MERDQPDPSLGSGDAFAGRNEPVRIQVHECIEPPVLAGVVASKEPVEIGLDFQVTAVADHVHAAAIVPGVRDELREVHASKHTRVHQGDLLGGEQAARLEFAYLVKARELL